MLFLISQTVSLFGSALVQYAISWYVTLETKDGGQMALITLCGFLPQMIVSIFAGVWADRYNRKMLIMLSDLGIALSTMALAIVFSTGRVDWWMLYVASVIRSIGAGIQTPAVSAMLPDIVPERRLLGVNGINASIQGIMMVVAPMAAAAMYGGLGLAPIFWVDVLTAAIGIGIMACISVAPRVQGGPASIDFKADVVLGLNYVRHTRWLMQLLVFYLVYAFMYGPVTMLTPLMVARSFGDEEWRLMAHEVAFGVGSLVGGAMLAVVGKRVPNKIHLLLIGSVAFGLLTFVMGLSTNFWFYIGVMLAMGVLLPFINSGTMTVLQMRVDPHMMGRVFGLVSIVGTAAVPLSTSLFGPLADVISVETELIWTGLGMTAIALYMFRKREVIQAGEPLEEPAHASASGASSIE